MSLPVGTYSFYSNFENCPHKAFHIYVAKDIPRVETPEMKWGNDVHSAMEERLRDDVSLPENMQQAEPIARVLCELKKTNPIRVEAQLAIDSYGNPCDYWKGNPWLRGKLDFVMVATQETKSAWMLDWKTGKVREEPFELEVGALLLKAWMPELAQIRAQYFWMQTGKSGVAYNINDHRTTWTKVNALREEAVNYLAAGVWPKRKNPLCGWCPVLSCEHNTSHKRK